MLFKCKKKRSDTGTDLCVWVHLGTSQLAQDALFRLPSVKGLVTGSSSSVKSSCPLPTEFKRKCEKCTHLKTTVMSLSHFIAVNTYLCTYAFMYTFMHIDLCVCMYVWCFSNINKLLRKGTLVFRSINVSLSSAAESHSAVWERYMREHSLTGMGCWEVGTTHSFSYGYGQSSMLSQNLKSGRLLVTGCQMLCILTWRSQADTLLGNGPHPVTWPLCRSEWPPLWSSCSCELGNLWAPRTGINVETTLWASHPLMTPELLIAFLQPQEQWV